MIFLFFTDILISVSTTAVAWRRKIKEASAPKESETSKSDKPNESDSIVTDKKPMVHTHHILSILYNSVISIHLSHLSLARARNPQRVRSVKLLRQLVQMAKINLLLKLDKDRRRNKKLLPLQEKGKRQVLQKLLLLAIKHPLRSLL